MTEGTPSSADIHDLKLQRSSRDAATVPGLLAGWLTTLLPAGAEPEVTLHSGIDSNGMSSETLILDATWAEEGKRRTRKYVARVTPAEADIPVFPVYDLQAQYDVMKIVGEVTEVPVPGLAYQEPTGSVLGTPFFLMDRVEGVVPSDVPPYNFGDNWLFDATADQQRTLQDSTVAALAGLHSIPDPLTRFAFLDRPGTGTTLERNLAWLNAWYEFAAADIGRSPLTDRALSWLVDNLPSEQEQGEPVLCWGDSRIGNAMYRNFEPVAILDWELATIGPRALDVSWLIFAHRVFETIAHVFELPGMPHFLVEKDVTETYRGLTGFDVGDLSWYHVYNAVNYSAVFMRTGTRSIHFGEIEKPDDIETLMHHRPLLEAVLAEVGA